MNDEEIRAKAKKDLTMLDNRIKILRQARAQAGLIKAHAIGREFHKRAIDARKALDGLEGLIEELEVGRSICMEVLGAEKVPIVIERKLKLVVNNTGGK